MIKLDPQLIKEIEQDIEGGLISKREHPECPYYILNYTPVAQYNWKWTRATINCRGLIIDEDWNIIARPFKKFFTVEQWKELRNSVHYLYGVKYKEMFDGPYNVQAKADGSLGILYWNSTQNQYCVATRGSFTSEQAIRGTDILNRVYNFTEYILEYGVMMNNNYTYLFEVIYPENRIVVNYGDCEQLVLLAIIDNETGKEIIIDRGESNQTNLYNLFPIVEQYRFDQDGRFNISGKWFDSWQNLKELNWANKEGFVVHFTDTDIRVKIKFEDYLKMHRLVAQLTPKTILEGLMTHGIHNAKNMIKELPDELYEEANEIQCGFLRHYYDLRTRANALHLLARKMDRKEFAIHFSGHDCQRIVFSMLDNKDEWFIEQQTWNIVEKWFKEGKVVVDAISKEVLER